LQFGGIQARRVGRAAAKAPDPRPPTGAGPELVLAVWHACGEAIPGHPAPSAAEEAEEGIDRRVKEARAAVLCVCAALVKPCRCAVCAPNGAGGASDSAAAAATGGPGLPVPAGCSFAAAARSFVYQEAKQRAAAASGALSGAAATADGALSASGPAAAAPASADAMLPPGVLGPSHSPHGSNHVPAASPAVVMYKADAPWTKIVVPPLVSQLLEFVFVCSNLAVRDAE
jgi:hypothetical protein